jgi:hypothetical protein
MRERKVVSAHVPEDDYKWLSERASAEDCTMSRIIRIAVREYRTRRGGNSVSEHISDDRQRNS